MSQEIRIKTGQRAEGEGLSSSRAKIASVKAADGAKDRLMINEERLTSGQRRPTADGRSPLKPHWGIICG